MLSTDAGCKEVSERVNETVIESQINSKTCLKVYVDNGGSRKHGPNESIRYIHTHTGLCSGKAKFNICDTIEPKSPHLENFYKIRFVAFFVARFSLSLGTLY